MLNSLSSICCLQKSQLCNFMHPRKNKVNEGNLLYRTMDLIEHKDKNEKKTGEWQAAGSPGMFSLRMPLRLSVPALNSVS